MLYDPSTSMSMTDFIAFGLSSEIYTSGQESFQRQRESEGMLTGARKFPAAPALREMG